MSDYNTKFFSRAVSGAAQGPATTVRPYQIEVFRASFDSRKPVNIERWKPTGTAGLVQDTVQNTAEGISAYIRVSFKIENVKFVVDRIVTQLDTSGQKHHIITGRDVDENAKVIDYYKLKMVDGEPAVFEAWSAND